MFSNLNYDMEITFKKIQLIFDIEIGNLQWSLHNFGKV